MAFESVRSYVQLASGLGEMTRARALDAAQGLLSLPGADEVTRRAAQASALADQLLEAAKANRASLLELVRHEVESALRTADVARVAELEAAKTTITALSKELGELRASVMAGGASVVATATRRPASTSRPASVSTAARRPSQAPAKKTAAEEPPAKKTAAEEPPAKKAPAKKAPAKKAPAKKASAAGTTKATTAKRATAKRATAKRATAKKSAARSTTAKKATTT